MALQPKIVDAAYLKPEEAALLLPTEFRTTDGGALEADSIAFTHTYDQVPSLCHLHFLLCNTAKH
jgi:hypothetical protein